MRKAYIIVILLVVSLIAFGACTQEPEPESSLPSPKLLSPSNDAVDIQLRPVLLWEAVPEVTVYELKVSLNSDFSDMVLDVSPVNASYELPGDLMPLTKYYWMVCVRPDLSNPDAPIACSEVWIFTTAEQSQPEPEPEPTPVSPTPIPETTSSPEPLAITAAQLTTEYDEIGLSAETKYKRQTLDVTGTFDRFDDSGVKPSMFFETDPDAWGLRGYFTDEQELAKAKTLTKGDEIVVRCTCEGSSMSGINIILSDCRFISPE